MDFGWIDFSRSERDKLVNLLSLLEESGILDELGIAPVRDAFSDVFFPGTSTIQTVPKYFFVVAYILKDFEKSGESSRERALQTIREAEKSVCEILGNKDGVIGRRALKSKGSWLKRTPADIYWAGMRKYGIITGEKMSIGEYVRNKCRLKKAKSLGIDTPKRERDGDEAEYDDIDAGREKGMMHIYMPCYKECWMTKKDFGIKLTKEEGAFLKNQIIMHCPNTLLAYVLEHNIQEFCAAESFYDIEQIAAVHPLPLEMKKKIDLAMRFSDFVYITRIAYNMVVCPNWVGDEEMEKYQGEIKSIAEALDIDDMFTTLRVDAPKLKKFLESAKECMIAEDIEGLKDVVAAREIQIKSSRARCKHPGEYDEQWYGGGYLDYRFGTAKLIVRDIFESEGL